MTRDLRADRRESRRLSSGAAGGRAPSHSRRARPARRRTPRLRRAGAPHAERAAKRRKLLRAADRPRARLVATTHNLAPRAPRGAGAARPGATLGGRVGSDRRVCRRGPRRSSSWCMFYARPRASRSPSRGVCVQWSLGVRVACIMLGVYEPCEIYTQRLKARALLARRRRVTWTQGACA